MTEMTPFYEQGQLLESEDDLNQAIRYTREGLIQENKSREFINNAISYLKQGYEDAPKSGPRG